jgi:calcineurin-like phosphoesterase family protein
MKTWATSDWHFKHSIMQQFRPHDYEEQTLRNYHDLVEPGDTVYFLGDMLFQVQYRSWMSKVLVDLPGQKLLIRGNHDSVKRFPDQYWYDSGFIEVYRHCHVVGDIMLSHLPIVNDRLNDDRYPELIDWLNRGFILCDLKHNVHGHTHDHVVKDDRCVNVSLENTGYRPHDISHMI